MIADPANARGEPADVYSLAKSLWVLATGRRVPLPGPLNVPQLALRNLVPHPRAQLLEPMLEFATRFDPAERPTLAGMAQELRQWSPPAGEPPVAAPEDLETARARITAILGPQLRADEAQLLRVRAANLAHTRLKAYLDPINVHLGEAIPINSQYNNTLAPFERFPQLGIADPTYQLGWASIFTTPGKGVTLFGWIGVQMHKSGSLRLAGAYALEPYEGTGRKLVWSAAFDVLPGGAAESEAIETIRQGLVANLPTAVAALADALENRRFE